MPIPQVTFTDHLSSPLEASDCIRLSVQVFNPVGMYSKTSKEIAGCSPDDVQRLVVVDAVGEWDLETTSVQPVSLVANEYWADPDREVTGSNSQLSAVWPALRHGYFSWKVSLCSSPMEEKVHAQFQTLFIQTYQNACWGHSSILYSKHYTCLKQSSH